MDFLPCALPYESLDVRSKALYVPDLKDAAAVLENGLKKTFSNVCVDIVECPDLTLEPFHLAAAGLSGSPRLLDIGGVPYLVPTPRREKLYDMKTFPLMTDMRDKDQLIIGAGAAPWTFLRRNAELVPNIFVKASGEVIQKSRIAYTIDADGSFKQESLPNAETKLGLLGNLFLSEGKQGPVIQVKCQHRTGQENFVTCMRKTLLERYEDKSVGIGGVFLVKSGKIRAHVMPDFSPRPLVSDDDVGKWLNYYEMSSPFVCTSIFVSKDPGLDLRIEHTHGFSMHGDAGHYHHDTSPDSVEYIGYFNVAEVCYRIDSPQETHMVGRD